MVFWPTLHILLCRQYYKIYVRATFANLNKISKNIYFTKSVYLAYSNSKIYQIVAGKCSKWILIRIIWFCNLWNYLCNHIVINMCCDGITTLPLQPNKHYTLIQRCCLFGPASQPVVQKDNNVESMFLWSALFVQLVETNYISLLSKKMQC